jgi:hypothetical protein
VHAIIDGQDCGGAVGGMLPIAEVKAVLEPAVVAAINAAVADDGPDGPAACAAAGDVCADTPAGEPTTCDVDRHLCVSSSAKVALGVLDADADGVITLAEARESPLFRDFFKPDLDDGFYSVGLGFHCVPASFDAPGEQAK